MNKTKRHFPLEDAAKIAIGTAKKFVADHPDKFDVIKWVLFDDKTLAVYEKELSVCMQFMSK
ncbi:MAG: hypothetical protein K2K46_11220 [Lachnospiraceae bacterium]|nr:hypothetical protein [Lachnospiraceae bacterium]